MRSGDGNTRDLLTTMPSAGWDYALTRHPYHKIERPKGSHYCVYNHRQRACCFDDHSTEDGYWRLRQLYLTQGNIRFSLKDRMRRDFWTCCSPKISPRPEWDDGGLLVDGILVRLSDDKFWYAQDDGDFYSWARAHAKAMDVTISDPNVFVSQVQGPNTLKILQAASDSSMPESFGYFAMSMASFDGQEVVITRTGYTNELGWSITQNPSTMPKHRGHICTLLENHTEWSCLDWMR